MKKIFATLLLVFTLIFATPLYNEMATGQSDIDNEEEPDQFVDNDMLNN